MPATQAPPIPPAISFEPEIYGKTQFLFRTTVNAANLIYPVD